MNTTPTLSCGHLPSPHGPHTTGTAHLADGREVCWECADNMQREDLKERKPVCAYVSIDGKRITTWSGGILMKVTHSATCKLTRVSFTHDRRSYRSIHARDVHGALWYGRGSAGVLIRMRPVKG